MSAARRQAHQLARVQAVKRPRDSYFITFFLDNFDTVTAVWKSRPQQADEPLKAGLAFEFGEGIRDITLKVGSNEFFNCDFRYVVALIPDFFFVAVEK